MILQSSNSLKTMKSFLSALLLAACSPCFAEPSHPEAPPSSPVVDKSVDDTLNRIRLEQIKALEAYMAANPNAGDRDEVLKDLIAECGKLAEHYRMLVDRDKQSGDQNRRLQALERQYSFMTKRANIELKPVSDNIVDRFFLVWKGVHSTTEEHKKAQALFNQGKKDFPALKDDPWFCRQESKLKLPRAGESMAFAFTALDGSKVDVAALKGKVVLVYAWEISEGRSLEELPVLKAIYQKFHDAGLEVIGIPFDTDEAALRAFIKKENIPWPQAFDGKGWKNDVAVKYGIYTIPLNFILGRDGKVADYQFLDSSELEVKVAKLLK